MERENKRDVWYTQIYYYTLVSFKFYYVNDNKTNINNRIKVTDAKRRQTPNNNVHCLYRYSIIIYLYRIVLSIERQVLEDSERD